MRPAADINSLLTAVLLALACWHTAALALDANSSSYSSLISPGVKTVYWQLSSDECTSAQALDISSGNILWQKTPVDWEQSWGSKCGRVEHRAQAVMPGQVPGHQALLNSCNVGTA
ncbi:hypothetical protein HaLaN_29761 [Haematococcus lacustris]|uniref:Uncharacterized protein n=1 Tax=Haematococcus lacustris TaxID=44745 RepID=A0A6A0ADS9_HAELA|nr:hypothetical protein HaLaN_29761 [Haematococcus lacustris]